MGRPDVDLNRVMRCSCSVLFLLALSVVVGAQEPPEDGRWQSASPTSDWAFMTWVDGGQEFYAISRDGGRSTVSIRPLDAVIRLRHATHDPLRDAAPAVPPFLTARPDSLLHIVQYRTQGLGVYREVIRDLGGEVLQFIAGQGNLVRMSGDVAEAVKRLPFVRWVGPFHAGYRVDEATRRELEARRAPIRDYWIHVTRKGLAEKEAVRAHIVALGGSPHPYLSPHGYLIRAGLAMNQLVEIIHRNDVLFVDPWTPQEPDMDNARILFGADHVETVAGYTGAGVRGEVRDTGFNHLHVDFQATPPIWHTSMIDSSHGSSTYGIVFGDGTGNAAARGVIPDAQGIMAWYSGIPDRYAHTQELLAPPYEAVFQTSSVGGTRTFFYTNTSANMDNILFDLDTIKTQSQSNAGNQDSRPEAWAKNIVSVGGIRHFNTLTTADDSWSSGGSIGPAQDGRIKPDISAFYDSTLTTTTGSPTAYTSNFGGTSGATPIVAGHFGLFFQMWNDGIFGNVVDPLGTVFSNRPHMTTAKAMMLNTATQYPFVGATHDLTRVHQGWGRPDVRTLYDERANVFIVDETEIIGELDTKRYFFSVTAVDTELQATLVFADPSGNPAATDARINDLTLRLIDPNGNVYWGNNGLLAGMASTSGGSPNTVDTVEQVIIPVPTPGMWNVDVMCFEINEDGHAETQALDVDYALVVRGGHEVSNATPPSGQPNSIAASFDVLGGINSLGQPAGVGINGPFRANLQGLTQLTLNFAAPPNRVFALFTGAINENNKVFATVGSLDIGLLGAQSDFSDLTVVLNGMAPSSFLDLLAGVGPSGTQHLTFSLPPGVSGPFGGFQALMIDPSNPLNVVLTAAFDLTN